MLGQVFDFKEAANKVLKRWYEQRIREETERNQILRVLHDALTKIKELRELQNARQQELDFIEKSERHFEKLREHMWLKKIEEEGLEGIEIGSIQEL